VSPVRYKLGVYIPEKDILETDPVSETLYFLVFTIPDDEQSPETELNVIHRHRSVSDCIYNC
jgi:hypothetical protein